MSNNITEEIFSRIETLLKLAKEDKLNKKNYKKSEKKLKKFLRYISLYKYSYSIGLDDNGYFTLEIKENNYHVLFIFRDRLNFYIYKNNVFMMSAEFENIKSSVTIIKYSLFNILQGSLF